MSKSDLTEGKILNKLFRLSMPIVLTGFVQTAYNLIDMFWIGKLGSNEVAAVGTAGFYMWLSQAFILLASAGCGIRVAQTTGEKNYHDAKAYARTGLHLAVIFGIVFSILIFIFKIQLINVFNIQDKKVVIMGIKYLSFVTFGIFFAFINQTYSGIFTGRGNSITPFLVNIVGLIFNLILDPLLILGIWGFPKLSVVGAAIATSISQLLVMILFICYIKFSGKLFEKFIFFKAFNFSKAKEIIKLGLPTAFYNGVFTLISMAIAVIIAKYGASAIAVQKVGGQVEAISWMTASGFSVAITSFCGQNFGAKKYHRVMEGYLSSLQISVGLGIITSLILIFGSKSIMGLFFPNDYKTVLLGADYLVIMGFSQIFMCLEITTSGAFNGIGKTMYPAVNSIILNLIRIPLAIILPSFMGLDGIWWALSISSIVKGIVLVCLFFAFVVRSDIFHVKDMFCKKIV